MGNFKEYAKLYDVIYADKDYKAEADYVIAFIKKTSSKGYNHTKPGLRHR